MGSLQSRTMLGIALTAALALGGIWSPYADAAGTFNIDSFSITVYYNATSEGPNTGNSAGQLANNDVNWGSLGWQFSDDLYGTVTLADNQLSSEALSGSHGFTIPGGATITGIEVHIERNGSADTVSTLSVNLKKSAITPVGTTKTSTAWPAADAVVTLGGPSDLWGTTWTDAEINAGQFGVFFFVGSSATALPALPASTPWGLIVTALLLVIVATVVLLRLRAHRA